MDFWKIPSTLYCCTQSKLQQKQISIVWRVLPTKIQKKLSESGLWTTSFTEYFI